jgi:hypothetical protein
VDLSDTFSLPPHVEDIASSQLGEKYEKKENEKGNHGKEKGRMKKAKGSEFKMCTYWRWRYKL